MAEITLKEGDFGADVEIRYGLEQIYLPDIEHPGLTVTLPLAAIVEMTTIEQGPSEGDANDKGGRAGRAGLVMGIVGGSKNRNVTFRARLEDGRAFVATTDFQTYADFHTAQIAARTEARNDMEAVDPADELIAHYLPFMKPPPLEPAGSVAIHKPPPVKPRAGRAAPMEFGRRRPAD